MRSARREQRWCSVQRDDPPSRGETAIRAAVRLVPSVGESLGIAVDDALDRRKARAQETAGRVEIEVGDDALLLERLEDERVQMLFAGALEAAMRSRVDAKRRLLARVVARAVMDGAQVDEAELVTTALAQLDAPHVRALERFVNGHLDLPVGGREFFPVADMGFPQPRTRVLPTG